VPSMHRKHSSSGRRSRIDRRNPGGVHRQVQKTDHTEEDHHHSTQGDAPLGPGDMAETYLLT
jgi:hypothetical protein